MATPLLAWGWVAATPAADIDETAMYRLTACEI
jgi:hypothetical protein